ncbi:6820_t:CDS:2 [Entrophospora sp. SA101]|nr:6820_t:CDS:2 [Entrophospora sp. SA101]
MIHELVACESYQLGIGTWDFCVDPAYGGRPAYVKIDSLPSHVLPMEIGSRIIELEALRGHSLRKLPVGVSDWVSALGLSIPADSLSSSSPPDNNDSTTNTTPVVGDLIIVDKDLINNDNDDEVASVNGVGGDDGKYEKEDNDFMTNSDDLKEIKVKILKKEDLSNYTINDVVLPLPGYSVIYPDNIIFDKYKELMYRDKLDPRSMRRSVKKLFKYDEVNVSLSLTDLDIINGKVEPENGKYVALRINFSLSTSKYATMTLRELMKSTDEYDNEEKKEIS